jgi:hypothetical protein
VNADLVLQVIAERLREWPVDRLEGALVIETVNLRVTCRVDEDDGRCALVTASHPSLPVPHEQHCAGWGDDDRTKAERAADVWLEGTFEVLHDFICEPKETAYVERLPFVVRDDDTGELKGFRMIVGPVEAVRTADVPDRIVPKTALLEPLVGPIGPLLLEGNVHWLRMFMGQMEDQSPAVDCWFDNVSWPEGAEALAGLRREWGPVPGFEGLRQSVLFKTVALDTIPARLIAELPPGA